MKHNFIPFPDAFFEICLYRAWIQCFSNIDLYKDSFFFGIRTATTGMASVMLLGSVFKMRKNDTYMFKVYWC